MPAWLLTLPTMFAKSSCALNPIIYTVMNSSFRKQVRNKLPIVENKSRGVATTEQNGPHCAFYPWEGDVGRGGIMYRVNHLTQRFYLAIWM